MDILKEFTDWALLQGVKPNGIALHKFPDRGVGIIAEQKFHAGDVILTVPISALRTILTVPKSMAAAIGAISVHGLLAADLCMDKSESRRSWRAMLPTKDDIEESLPFMWHSSLQALLPPISTSLLENQKKKLSQDWEMVSAAFPDLSYNAYVYSWFLINTRTFYFTSPKIKTRKPVKHDDCIALSPFADGFNHADTGCKVTLMPSGYQVSTDRAIQKGEEIYISYGNHSNDFLLTEYGFFLDENRWDELCLDEFVLPLFSSEQKEQLEEAGFLGRYMLDLDTVCYRTQLALRLLCMPVRKWQILVANGLESGDEYETRVNGILLELLDANLKSVDGKLRQVEALDHGLSSQRTTLLRRWQQIRLLLAASIRRLGT